MFCLIRNYSGGIHARTEGGCSLITTVVLFLSIFTIKILDMLDVTWVAACTLFVSAVCIIVISPIDNNNKKLKKHEIDQNHKKSILLISITILLFIFFLVIKKQIISISISVSATFANILFLAGKTQQKTINCKKNSA